MHTEPGRLPQIGGLLAEAADDLRSDPGGWLLAGVGLTLVAYALPLLGILLFAALVVPLAVMGPVRGSPVLVTLAAIATLLLTIAAFGPFLASAYRAARERAVAGRELGLGAPFGHLGHRIGSALLASLVVGTLLVLGGVLLLVPGILIGWLLMWTLPAVFLHDRPVGAALGSSIALTRRAPGWTLQVALVGIVGVLLTSAVPVFGPLLVLPFWIGFHTRAFHAAEGLVHTEPPEAEEMLRPGEHWPHPPLET